MVMAATKWSPSPCTYTTYVRVVQQKQQRDETILTPAPPSVNVFQSHSKTFRFACGEPKGLGGGFESHRQSSSQAFESLRRTIVLSGTGPFGPRSGQNDRCDVPSLTSTPAAAWLVVFGDVVYTWDDDSSHVYTTSPNTLTISQTSNLAVLRLRDLRVPHIRVQRN